MTVNRRYKRTVGTSPPSEDARLISEVVWSRCQDSRFNEGIGQIEWARQVTNGNVVIRSIDSSVEIFVLQIRIHNTIS